jgi:hypothetical protein
LKTVFGPLGYSNPITARPLPENSHFYHGLLAGASGNRSIWVFAQIAGAWQNVLDDIGQSLKKKKNRTNGWHDLELQRHDSATESTHVFFQFDGSRYRPVTCFVLRFPMDDDGQVESKPVRERCDWDWQQRVQPKTPRRP